MTVPGRYTCVSVSIVFALFVAACSGQSSFSATSPSSVGGRGVAGAVISGTMTDSSIRTLSATGLTTQTAASAPSRPVTVSVVGTNISTAVDGSGRFQLTGVPAGDVQLKFTATGLDATLMLKGVQAGDRIDIKVRLTDTTIRIEAERRDRDDDDDDEEDRDDDEFKGIVSALSGTCPDIAFALNGAKRQCQQRDGL